MRSELVPSLKDNYIFVIRADDGEALVVDPGDAAPIKAYLEKENLKLAGVLITHHHWDHTDGVSDLLDGRALPVWVPAADRGRWKFATHFVHDGDWVKWKSLKFQVLELPGHTQDHVAYFEASKKWLFSGDVLFGMGCGRLFEGNYEQMHKAMSRLRELPDRTSVFCAHEYTEINLRFLHQMNLAPSSPDFADFEEKIHALRAQGKPTVPRLLYEEKNWNPFLKATSPEALQSLREARNQFSPSVQAP